MKQYIKPMLSVEVFEAEDIITTSVTEGDLSDFLAPGGDTFNGSDLF